MKPRKTLTEMARTEVPLTVAGRPADKCPHCGCGMIIDGVNKTEHDIVRYVECRNQKCRRRFMTRQPPAKIVREIEDNSACGKDDLTMSLKYA